RFDVIWTTTTRIKDRTMISNKLTARLSDPSLVRTQAFIGGEWVSSSANAVIDVTNPATGELLAQVPDMRLENTRQAVDLAAKAQKDWAAATGKERAAILRRFYDLVMASQEDLAIILTAEMGKPLAESRGEVAYGASYIEWFGEETKRIYGDTVPGHH